MAVAVINRMYGIKGWMKNNPQIVEPNMREFSELILDISRLKSAKRDKALEVFSDIYSIRFGAKNCPDRSKSCMWQLFKKVATTIIADDYVCNEVTEERLINMLMGIGNYCLQQREIGRMYDNSDEFNQLTELIESYDGQFKELCLAAYDEIKSCYKAA